MAEHEDVKVVDEHLLNYVGGLARQMVKRERSEARLGGRTQISESPEDEVEHKRRRTEITREWITLRERHLLLWVFKQKRLQDFLADKK